MGHWRPASTPSFVDGRREPQPGACFRSTPPCVQKWPAVSRHSDSEVRRAAPLVRPLATRGHAMGIFNETPALHAGLRAIMIQPAHAHAAPPASRLSRSH